MSKPNTHSNSQPPLAIERLPIRLVSDDRRVITRPFLPGDETRICRVVERVNQLTEREVKRLLSEVSGENLYIMYSDMVHFWETAKLLQRPKRPWEFIQIGNCGSPLETPEG